MPKTKETIKPIAIIYRSYLDKSLIDDDSSNITAEKITGTPNIKENLAEVL